jgi:hypothetical protein
MPFLRQFRLVEIKTRQPKCLFQCAEYFPCLVGKLRSLAAIRQSCDKSFLAFDTRFRLGDMPARL